MKNIIKKFILLALIFNFSLLSVKAAVVLQESDAPASDGNYFISSSDESYVTPTNTYDNAQKYYFVTQNGSFSLPADQTITYNGEKYKISIVITCGTNIPFDLIGAGPEKIFSPNSTIFFDDGVYNDTSISNINAFNHENLSIIGLHKKEVVENGVTKLVPATTITKSPITSSDPLLNDTNGRYQISSKNVYIENIIFDGNGKDMHPVGGGSVDQNKGEFLFSLDGSLSGGTDGVDGFVFKNNIIQNVGKENTDPFSDTVDYRNKNTAINIFRSTGQVNIEDLIIKNIKTTESKDATNKIAGYGIISQDQASKTFYKNISIDSTAAAANSQSIKIENTSNETIFPETNTNAVLSGDIEFITNEGDGLHKNIFVQNSSYESIKVPSSFRYASYNTVNGDNKSYVVGIYKNYDDIPLSELDSHAILDLSDNYWIINLDKTNTNPDEINLKLTTIASVMESFGSKVPGANVKVSSKNPIKSFTVPDYFANKNLNLVALNSFDGLYSSKDLVPVEKDTIITLPNSNNTKLYNFDFHTIAKYTMLKAIEGIPNQLSILSDHFPDFDRDNYPDYPYYDRYYKKTPIRVKNSIENTFVNCKFTVLANFVSFDAGGLPTETTVGRKFKMTKEVGSGITYKTALDKSLVDDNRVFWVTSDPEIAYIDEEGYLHIKSAGDFQIYFKALDSYNDGEIEKPHNFAEYIQVYPNIIPTINAHDKIIPKGQKLELLSLVDSASDAEDGDLLKDKSLVVSNDGGFNKDIPGIYNVTFKVTDTLNAVGTTTVKVTVVAPATIITHDKTIKLNTPFTDKDILALVDSAIDGFSNDITSEVIIANNGNFKSSVLGTYTITFRVVDSLNQVTTKTAMIKVEDETKKIPSTPAPTPKPTSVPVKGRSCQDDGYPAGYYWDETKQACVINTPSKLYKVPHTATDNNIIGYVIVIALGGIALFFVNKKRK